MNLSRVVLVACLFSPVAIGTEPTPPSQHLFDSGKEGYKRYRIPSLIVTPRGTTLAICEGRKDGRGLTGNIDLVLKRSIDSGKTWGPIEVIADDGDNTLGNPCPVIDSRTGTIWLPFTRSLGSDVEDQIVAGTSRETTRVFITSSTDDGRTWAKPREITATASRPDWTWYGTGPGVGIQLKSGRLFIPSYHAEKATKKYHSHSLYSDDGGKTWKLGATVDANTSEPQAAERRDGALVLSARTSLGPGKGLPLEKPQRTIVLSQDGGETWKPAAFDASLHDPSCQASLYPWPNPSENGTTWLYSHPAGPGRRNLTLRTSQDEGRTWSTGPLLREGDAQYSSLARLPDGEVGCLFESWVNNNYHMFFTRFPLPGTK